MWHYRDIGRDELRDFIGKGWLTHDGTWFISAACQPGLEAANQNFNTSPPVSKCNMHTTGACSGEFRVSFPFEGGRCQDA